MRGSAPAPRAAPPQMLHARPDVTVLTFRGNVSPRGSPSWPAGEADVTLLAAAGLARLRARGEVGTAVRRLDAAPRGARFRLNAAPSLEKHRMTGIYGYRYAWR
nr:hypothetical protein [Novosphingobium sp. Gsoil 351]